MTQKLNNRYQVIRLLSSGGFGETFLATDGYMPSNKPCVIKQLKPISNDTQTYQLVRERFQREAAIIEKLSELSCQIPRLYAYFCESGKFFLVEEWVEGKTIADVVQQLGPLKQGAVIQILKSLLQILEQVHSQGIIHRDIKPENIILRQQDCQPVLLDFGAVKETMKLQAHTQSSARSIAIGTPGFISLEQAAGYSVFATDLYQLGLTAIYILTGKMPPQLDRDLMTGEFRWRSHAPNLSEGLAAVIDRSIQPHPGDRFASARSMLAALNASSSHTVELARQSTATVENREITDNCPTVVSHTALKGSSPTRHLNWYSCCKNAIIATFVLGVPVILLFNLNKLESSKPNKPVPQPDSKSSANSPDTTVQKNLKKLLATKKCRRCNLSRVNLSNANLSNADLTGANLSRTVLSSANLFQAKLQGSNLEKAKLNRANLYGAKLNQADLEGADLSDTNFSRAYLSNANLGNTNLVNANLSMARLSFANLTGANLSNANLRNSYLKRANLFKAQLNGANLTGAKLCSSIKNSCVNLDNTSLKGATVP